MLVPESAAGHIFTIFPIVICPVPMSHIIKSKYVKQLERQYNYKISTNHAILHNG